MGSKTSLLVLVSVNPYSGVELCNCCKQVCFVDLQYDEHLLFYEVTRVVLIVLSKTALIKIH